MGYPSKTGSAIELLSKCLHKCLEHYFDTLCLLCNSHYSASFRKPNKNRNKSDLVLDVVEVSREVLFAAVQKPLGLRVRSAEGQEVNGSQSGLLARRHKDNDGKLGRVLADGVVDRLHHGDEAGGSVGDGEALDVQLQGNWAHVRVEAEESVSGGPQPLAQVLGVGHG